MAIKETACKFLVCDTCGGECEDGDGVIRHYETEGDALAEGENYDWIICEGGHFCEGCRPACRCSDSFKEHDYGAGPCETCGDCEKFEPAPPEVAAR